MTGYMIYLFKSNEIYYSSKKIDAIETVIIREISIDCIILQQYFY